MKKSETIKKIREIESNIEIKHLEKLRQLQAEMDIENRESNKNRARSITIGTSFGGTSEIMMRGDGGRHLWCLMQPVEVIELIHQLSANVGCQAQLNPRKDFSTWRDWRVSEAEQKHLNGHPPFVNDMAVFQKLGASGYNDEEAKKIMDIISNTKEYCNENDDAKIVMQDKKIDGTTNLMLGEEDNLLHNKVILQDHKVIYMAGGNGGIGHLPNKEDLENETVAINKPTNGRKNRRSAKSS